MRTSLAAASRRNILSLGSALATIFPALISPHPPDPRSPHSEQPFLLHHYLGGVVVGGAWFVCAFYETSPFNVSHDELHYVLTTAKTQVRKGFKESIVIQRLIK